MRMNVQELDSNCDTLFAFQNNWETRKPEKCGDDHQNQHAGLLLYVISVNSSLPVPLVLYW